MIFALVSCGNIGDDAPQGYGKVRVSFGGSARNVTQADKDAATLRVYFNGNPVEQNGDVFEGRVESGIRLTITAEAVSGGRIIGKDEESITVKSGTNDVQMKIYTWDNFVVTVNGKSTGYTTFTDAWDAISVSSAQGNATVTLKMNADVTVTQTLQTNNSDDLVTIDLNGHTITGNGTTEVILISHGNYVWKNGTIRQPPNSSSRVITVDTATFNMYDVTITGGNDAGFSGGGVFVADSTTFNMYGGSITGNKAATGGGVWVDSDGTFNWYGGTISGNTASQSGNNVYVSQGATYTRNGVPQDTSQDVIID